MLIAVDRSEALRRLRGFAAHMTADLASRIADFEQFIRESSRGLGNLEQSRQRAVDAGDLRGPSLRTAPRS